ncbi:hypothetical protein [Nocardia miyunensis]|uniref:hypothetical protein n=1 Tax=Nocardia miyunensis TaxID=282684 RepID=UPI00082E7544|nr:hypothetical protein [Nocardia miyunensis]
MARRKQSADAQGSTAQGAEPWPVAEPEEDRWGTAQNRRLPPEPDGQRWDNGPTGRHPVQAPAGRPDTGQNRRLAPSPEGERWEAAQTRRQAPAAEDNGYDSDRTRRRAAVAEADEDYYESAPSRRRSGRLRVEVAPIVNPYSIVALVGALLALFPVAIVFGFISFTHPRGRMMALFALLIGAAEATALVGLLALSGVSVPHNPFRLQAGSTPVSQTAPATASDVPPVQVTVSTAAPTTSAAQTAVAQGEVCTETQAALIGTTSDGNTLLCLKGSSGYRWTGPYTVSTAVYDNGSKCNAASDKSARTADGRALVCEGQGRSAAWTLWVE